MSVTAGNVVIEDAGWPVNDEVRFNMREERKVTRWRTICLKTRLTASFAICHFSLPADLICIKSRLHWPSLTKGGNQYPIVFIELHQSSTRFSW